MVRSAAAAAGKMTTELQPSPPGYRQQDGGAECPASKLYHHHHRGYSSTGSSDYIQQPARLRKDSPDTTNEINAKNHSGVDRYDEQKQTYGKKNAPGYKNDSG